MPGSRSDWVGSAVLFSSGADSRSDGIVAARDTRFVAIQCDQCERHCRDRTPAFARGCSFVKARNFPLSHDGVVHIPKNDLRRAGLAVCLIQRQEWSPSTVLPRATSITISRARRRAGLSTDADCLARVLERQAISIPVAQMAEQSKIVACRKIDPPAPGGACRRGNRNHVDLRRIVDRQLAKQAVRVRSPASPPVSWLRQIKCESPAR